MSTNRPAGNGGLAELFRKKLEYSNIDLGLAKRLKFKLVDKEHSPPGLPVAAGGFIIPYFDLKGSPTQFWRYRYLEDTRVGTFATQTEEKPLRYAQPGKSINELYLPPLVSWNDVAKNSSQPIVITEGELKSACATAFTKYPTVGLGGVWCFRAGVHNLHLLPMFDNFVWKDREVFVAYDSDAATNPKVIVAENALAHELLRLGANPRIVRVPSLPQVKKTGLDDYIVARGGNGAFEDLLDRASKWSAAKELHTLNEEVVYVRDPGMLIRFDTNQRISPRAFVEHAFSTRIYHEQVSDSKGEKTRLVEKSAPREWLKWPHRAEVARTVYEPGSPQITDGSYNLWSGWGCEPKRGEIGPWRELLDYMFKGHPAERKWFEQWCAYPIQHPGFKMYSAVLVWGSAHGTGKSFVGYSLFKIYGKENSIEVKDRHLQSAHNEWAENKQFVMGDEITGNDRRSAANDLMSLITQQEIIVDRKYIPTFTIRDCINWYFTSNQPDAIFLQDKDRRYFIHEVLGDPLPREFYVKYEDWIGGPHILGPGVPALFYHLLHVDLTGFDPRGPAPFTVAKYNMLELGRSDIGTWVHALSENPGSVLRIGDVPINYAVWRVEDLLRIYDPDGRTRVTANGLARELRRQGFRQAYNGMPVPTRTDGQVRLWVIRSIPDKIANSGKVGLLYDDERRIHVKYKPREKPQ